MAIDIKYEPEKGYLYISVMGQCTVEDYEKAMEEIKHSKQYPANINALWDVREQNFSNVTKSTVQSLVNVSKRYPERGSAKAAFIVNGDLAFGMLRMYEITSSVEQNKTSQYLRVFRNYSEGEKWLLDDN